MPKTPAPLLLFSTLLRLSRVLLRLREVLTMLVERRRTV
jgi:hypothetical protein